MFRSTTPSDNPTAKIEINASSERPPVRARSKRRRLPSGKWNLSRFYYWMLPSINLWAILLRQDILPGTLDAARLKAIRETPVDPYADDRIAHELLRDGYEAEYRAGNKQAIYEYARADNWAMSASWVIEELEKWRKQGPSGKVKLADFRTALNHAKGRTQPDELYSVVRKDQTAFRTMIELNQNGISLEKARAAAADDDGRGVDTMKRVYDEYIVLYKRVVVTGLFSHDELFQELRRMADRIIAPKSR